MFKEFKRAIASQFDRMKSYPLFRTEVEKSLLWMAYLESFPEGTNPIYRESTEHDCNACKSFIRTVGNLVAVIDGDLVSLWDCEASYPYNVVAKILSELVKSAPIRNVFLHDQHSIGVERSYQNVDTDILVWEHFFLSIPCNCVSSERGRIYSRKRSSKELFARGLSEIELSAIETVLELIDQRSLYRGDEFKRSVLLFLEQKRLFDLLETDRQRDIFCWNQSVSLAVLRIRNSVIGTLLVDLSEGKELDDAVRLYESKVAPENYKRPKALVTKSMIERAQKQVEELGYMPALGRRFAVVDDLTINNVLFADRDARKAMTGNVFDEMISEEVIDRSHLAKVESIDIESFITNVMPKVNQMELLVENSHANNLVNLVAPKDAHSRGLFKWDNNFSWCYAGDVADSIKSRVKRAGGSVTGVLRISLGWFNSDDLDLHVIEPLGGIEICYRRTHSRVSDGTLDVDMNVHASGPNTSRNAVENVTYPNRDKILNGSYKVVVHNFNHREFIDTGFEVEIEYEGQLYTFAYDREVGAKQSVSVVTFWYDNDGLRIVESIQRKNASKKIWGVQTQTYTPVSMVMYSPNHWDGRGVGNKHYFFMLDGCKRDGSSRGFYNEYLSNDLAEHRKVFEILGSKMRTETEGEQLSGLGFSSTKRNHVYVRVTGSFTRTLKINF